MIPKKKLVTNQKRYNYTDMVEKLIDLCLVVQLTKTDMDDKI